MTDLEVGSIEEIDTVTPERVEYDIVADSLETCDLVVPERVDVTMGPTT